MVTPLVKTERVAVELEAARHAVAAAARLVGGTDQRRAPLGTTRNTGNREATRSNSESGASL
jgi:hypothetical protein